MAPVIKKIKFLFAATAGILSPVKMIWKSKLLRWSKTGKVKPRRESLFTLSLKWPVKKKIWLRTYEGDIDIFYEVLFKKIYDTGSIPAGAVRTIVDAGANVGLSALFFLYKYPGAVIICVEPDPANFLLLGKNLEAEAGSGKVQLLNAALMQHDGEVDLSIGFPAYNSTVEGNGVNTVRVKSLGMDTLLKQAGIENIDLLKIDIEGAEKYVFSGECAWLRQVKNIIIEIHSPADQAVFSDVMEQHGFRVQKMNDGAAGGSLYIASAMPDDKR